MLREWLRRFAGAVRRRRSDGELEEELQLHLELAADAERRRGRTAEEAGRVARIRAGGVAQAMDALRDQRGVPLVSGLGQDLRMALRSLRATPLVTAVAIVSLALAIGANTAIFSIVDSLLLRSLPVHDPHRLVHVTDSVRRDTGEIRVRAWSHPFWEEIEKRRDLFEGATAWAGTRFDLAAGGETQFADGVWADGGFFETLGVHAVLGRTFSHLDDRPGGGPDGAVAVISYGYWKRQFGGARDVIGRSVPLNGVPYTIVGVTPADFFGLDVGRTFDLVVPLRTEPLIRGRDSLLGSASTNFLNVLARLKPAQSIDAAAAGLRHAQSQIREATLGPWDKEQVDAYLASPFNLVPAAGGYSNLRRSFERPLMIIAVVVALVLLIGCLNVANLLLARAIARRHELSVQVALGASRWRVARQLFAESAALSVFGAALGVFIAGAGSAFLVRQLSTPANTVILDVSVNGRVLAFTLTIMVLTTLLFGTAPAFRAARARPIDALKEWTRTSTDHTRGGLMAWLVAVQVALSVVLLVSAGLFVRSFTSLAARELGFEPNQVLVATIDPQRTGLEPAQRLALFERVREAVLQLPDVTEAAISYLTPVGGGGFTPAVEVSNPAGSIRVGANGDVYGNLVSPGWFRTFGTQVLAGRDFTDADRKGAPGVAIVNETFARKFLTNGNPLGRTITIYPHTPRALRMQVLGVVADAVYSSPRELPPPTWYVPLAQFDVMGFRLTSGRLSVRVNAGSPALLTKSIAAAAVGVHPQLALTFRPLADQVRGSLTLDRLMAQLASFFGAVALLLAGLGLYGVTAYAISGRRKEIGIRLALGARPTDVIRSVCARILVLLAVGIIAGGAITLLAARFVAGLLYGLSPRDPATLVGASMVLLATGALAGWVPARRAARTDPGAVLREV